MKRKRDGNDKKNKDKKKSKFGKSSKKQNGKADKPSEASAIADIKSIASVVDLNTSLSTEQIGKNNPPPSDYRIGKETLDLLDHRGIKTLFPVQVKTFDHIYDGKDVIVRALTGSGKTLAFGLPVMELLKKQHAINPRIPREPLALCLAPTRELALQIQHELSSIAGPHIHGVCVYGGTPYYAQHTALRRGVHYVVGTPGRIIDLLEQGSLNLSAIKYMILDEADQMLAIGFQKEVERILNDVPPVGNRQTMLFSATVPSWVQDIAQRHMKDTVFVDLIGIMPTKTPKQVVHYAIVCPPSVRQSTLADVVLLYGAGGRTIVFTNTKAEANELALSSSIKDDCQVLHGDIAQQQREVTLREFREGSFATLVATDVAARGLDIPEVDLIVQCQPPADMDSYVHRSGRTGRAGRKGTCVTFFTDRDMKDGAIKKLERKIGMPLKRIGTPQPQDLLEVSIEKALRKMRDDVEEDVINDHFMSVAEKVITKEYFGDGKKALAHALSVLTGYTHPPTTRSLLASMEGYTTLKVTSTDRPIMSPMMIVRIVNTMLDLQSENEARIREISLCVDEHSAVFDAPCEVADKLVDISSKQLNNRFVMEIITELPELKDRDNNRFGNNNNRFGNNNNRFGNNNGNNRFGNNNNRYGNNNNGFNNNRFGNNNNGFNNNNRFGNNNNGFNNNNRFGNNNNGFNNNNRFGNNKDGFKNNNRFGKQNNENGGGDMSIRI